MKGCTVIALMYSGARKTPTDMILLKPDKLQKCTHARHARRRHMKTLTHHEYLTACEVDHVYNEFLYHTPDAHKACTDHSTEQAHSHAAAGRALWERNYLIDENKSSDAVDCRSGASHRPFHREYVGILRGQQTQHTASQHM